MGQQQLAVSGSFLAMFSRAKTVSLFFFFFFLAQLSAICMAQGRLDKANFTTVQQLISTTLKVALAK